MSGSYTNDHEGVGFIQLGHCEMLTI